MFVLRSKFGNLIKRTENEREKEILLDMGYTFIEEKTTEADVDKMTVPELEAFAKEKGINLSDCRNKFEKLEKIKNSI